MVQFIKTRPLKYEKEGSYSHSFCDSKIILIWNLKMTKKIIDQSLMNRDVNPLKYQQTKPNDILKSQYTVI